jgi:hypothetical protein
METREMHTSHTQHGRASSDLTDGGFAGNHAVQALHNNGVVLILHVDTVKVADAERLLSPSTASKSGPQKRYLRAASTYNHQMTGWPIGHPEPRHGQRPRHNTCCNRKWLSNGRGPDPRIRLMHDEALSEQTQYPDCMRYSAISVTVNTQRLESSTLSFAGGSMSDTQLGD